jgi:DNA polymerase-4
MWGVGPVTRARLADTGIRTIGELAATPGPFLQRLLGQAVGDKLGSLAANTDPRRIETERRARSVGAQSALGRRTATPELVRSTLAYLADRVAARIRAAGRAGRTITVRVRFPGLRSVTRSVTLPFAISATVTLTDLATELVGVALADHPAEHEITLLSVSVSNLVDESPLQLELSLGLDDDRHRPGTVRGAARWALDRSVDAIRGRFGRDSVGYAAVMFSEVSRVPEEFRELAQHDPSALPADP